MFNIICTSPASFNSVTPAQLQYWARTNLPLQTNNENNQEYALLQSLIAAAEDQFQNDTGGCVINSSTWQMQLDNWNYKDLRATDGWLGYEGLYQGQYETSVTHPPVLYISSTPVTEITTVQYLDPTNTWTDLTGWTEDINNTPARVIMPFNFPTTSNSQMPRVQVTFTAGWSQNTAPSLIQTAIMLWANSLYSQRELTKTELGHWERIVGRYRIGVTGNWN